MNHNTFTVCRNIVKTTQMVSKKISETFPERKLCSMEFMYSWLGFLLLLLLYYFFTITAHLVRHFTGKTTPRV